MVTILESFQSLNADVSLHNWSAWVTFLASNTEKGRGIVCKCKPLILKTLLSCCFPEFPEHL